MKSCARVIKVVSSEFSAVMCVGKQRRIVNAVSFRVFRRFIFPAALMCVLCQVSDAHAQGLKTDGTGGPGGTTNPVVALTSSNATSTYGTAANFTVTIAPATCATTAGYVTFYDGATNIGTAYWSGTPIAAHFTISNLSAGSNTITAAYGGYTSSQISCNAETSNAVTQTVTPATPTISIANIPARATYGGSFSPTYSYSGNGSPTESVSSSTTGVCTAAGSIVNYVGVGTCTLSAAASATTDFIGATGPAQSFTVGQATPTISIGNIPGSAQYGGSFSASFLYSGNGSPAESVSSSTTAVCTVSGSTISYVGVGTCSLVASAAATTDYVAATGSSQSFAVSKGTASISISNIPSNPLYGSSFTATYTYSGTGSPTESLTSTTTSACTVSGNTVSFVGVGICTLQASATATTDDAAVTGNPQSTTVIIYDAGTVKLSVGGVQVATATYGQNSRPSVIAAALVGTYGNITVQNVDSVLYISDSSTGVDPSYSLGVTSLYPSIFTTPSFSGSPSTGNLEGGAASGGSPQTVYSYSISYDPGSRVTGYSDAVMGTWSNIGYDSLNRLVSTENTAASSVSAAYAGAYICWAYDIYGNRTAQNIQTSPCPSSPAPTASYNTKNQVTWTSVNGAGAGFFYDAAGNVINDTSNQYLYDGEGRLCAVMNLTVGAMTGYIYDADGNRVSKGSITSMSCNPATNGFQAASDYVLGPSGEQIAELGRNSNGAMTWQHSNVWAGGQMIATYDPVGLHFYANDWLGTRRVQTDYAAVSEQSCASLPFGDSLACSDSNSTPTEQHYTGKERDTESGLDYFGARYYGSSMGRFMSPDDGSGVYADPTNPQSWNLYGYVRNNPLTNVDPDGHDCVTDNGNGSATINSGDCSGKDPNNEYYYNCDGCLMGTTSANMTTNGSLSLFNGSTNTAYSISGYGNQSYGPLDGPANQAGLALLSNTNNGVEDLATPLMVGLTLAIPGALETELPGAGLGIGGVGAAEAAGAHPSTPTGQRGSPMNVPRGTNAPEMINGRQYTGHALDQMQSRGIPSSVVEDAIQNGIKSPGNTPGTTMNQSGNVAVVTNSSGGVVTVIPR